MSTAVDLIQDWRLLVLLLGGLGVAPGAVLRVLVRAYPKGHPRRDELWGELCKMGYLQRPLYVAEQIELAIFEGLPIRWRARRQTERAASRRERLRDWRRAYFPLPDEVMDDYLAEDEYVVHYDHPSFRAFVIQSVAQVLAVTVVGALLVILLPGVFLWDLGMALAFVALDMVLIYLAFRRLEGQYTNYIITNLRLIRLSGIVSRRLSSIAWTRLTGIGYRQTSLGALLGYATISIESANEESGLRMFSEINDPETFHEIMLSMVSGKAGPWENDDPPPPPTRGERKSLRNKRRERSADMRLTAAIEGSGPRTMRVETGEPSVKRDLHTFLAIAAAVVALVSLVHRLQTNRRHTKS